MNHDVYRIAAAVRRSAEIQYRRNKYLAQVCEIVSFSFWCLLRAAGVEARLMCGEWGYQDVRPVFGCREHIEISRYAKRPEPHVWVEVAGHWWDLTYTQFDHDALPITVTQKGDIRYRPSGAPRENKELIWMQLEAVGCAAETREIMVRVPQLLGDNR